MRLDLDGSNRTVVAKGVFNSMNITPYGIFYADGIVSGLHRMDLSGKSMTELLPDVSRRINVCGEWIFFSDSFEGNALYRVRIDGEMFEKIS